MTTNLREFIKTSVSSAISKNEKVLKFKSEIQNTRKYEEAPIA